MSARAVAKKHTPQPCKPNETLGFFTAQGMELRTRRSHATALRPWRTSSTFRCSGSASSQLPRACRLVPKLRGPGYRSLCSTALLKTSPIIAPFGLRLGKAQKNRAFSSEAKLCIEVSVSGCSSPSLALPRGLISCHANCIASKHHDRLQTLSISLGSYSCDMLWIPLIEAPGSDGLRPQPHMLQAAHPALRALFPELVLARKVRRPGESEESQTSAVRGLATNSDCIRHRMESILCRICACQHTLSLSHCRGTKSSTTTLKA